MAGFIRRFTVFPPLTEITSIEGVNIIDLLPPGIFVGLTTGTVLLVGEWPKGPQNEPTVVVGDRTIQNDFGDFSLSVTDPLSFSTNPYSNGNAFCWLKGKRFQKLVLCRVDMDLAEGVQLQITGTVIDPTTGSAVTVIPDGLQIVVPAGTRVNASGAPTEEFALSADVVFGATTDLTAATFATFDPDTPFYTDRTVEDVPVYSTQGNNESLVGDVDTVNTTDLFNADLGTGTSQPGVVVATSTGALDGSGANAAVLTALTSGQIDTAYNNAIDATKPGDESVDDVVIIASARQSSAIRGRLLTNARDSSNVGRGRIALNRPPIGTLPGLTAGQAQSSTDPGVGANRSDRVVYCYPHFEQTIDEIAALDPQAVISAPQIFIGADAAMASILSTLPPENNPGQSTGGIVTGGLLSFIERLEPGLTGAGLPTKFILEDYKAFKASGIAALRRSPEISEWVFQSGVTSVDPVNFPQLAPIKRRRMADNIQDSLAAIVLKYNKLPNTVERYDSLVGDVDDHLDQLLSPNNPAQQRIEGYTLDAKTGNSDDLSAIGIRILIIKVRLLSSMDHIVLQTTIGETVTIEALDPAAA